MSVKEINPEIQKFAFRIKELIRCAGTICVDDLKRERRLYQLKWFDYCFLSPAKATKLFADSYIKAYREAWARHFDRDESARRRGLFKVPSFSAPDPSSKERQLLTSLWRARQFADELGVPYDFFCRSAFQFWLDQGPTRLPQPNQLYSAQWRERIAAAVTSTWEERRNSMEMYAKARQFLAAAKRDTAAQKRYVQWVVDTLRRKHGHPHQIAWAISRNILTEVEALDAFGAERIESARSMAMENAPGDISDLTPYSFVPSCAGIAHAFEADATECNACHFMPKCRTAQPKILERVTAQYGSANPMLQRKRTSTSRRVAKHRARKKALRRTAAETAETRCSAKSGAERL